MKHKSYYTVAEVAQKWGMTAHTLRYYDKEGLLPFVHRSPSGTRQFQEADFEGLSIITCLKETGMPLKDIKAFMQWCGQGDATIIQRLEMFQKQKKKVEDQIKEFKKNLKKIEYKIWYYKTAAEAGTVDIHTQK